ncbi:MAG TPA: hypothetical protein VFI37_09770 [Gaiellaceae bacterium]|jgi:hypothetical protein|nr:hypothetical protein [Gaiellaceae bacterium]
MSEYESDRARDPDELDEPDDDDELDDELLEEQEGKGYGEDEGERDESLPEE